MSQFFSSDLLEHMSAELGCNVEDITNAFKTFILPAEESKVVEPKKKNIPSKTSESRGKKVQSKIKNFGDEKHTCARIPVRKNGEKGPCGKNAKNQVEIDGKMVWYCGTEKSGCYKSILGALKRNEKTSDHDEEDEGNVSVKKAPKGKNLTDNKSTSDSKAKSLINSVVSSKKIMPRKMRIGDNVIYVDHESKVVFDRETQEAYGILGKDNKIKSLDDKTIRWLEASDIKIRSGKESSKKTELKKKLSKAAPKDESDDDDDEIVKLQDDIEDADVGDDEDVEDEDDDIDLGSDDDENDDDEFDLGSDEDDD